LLTGDYIDQSSAYIAPVAAALGRLRPRIGAVAVLGNHDWLEGAELVRREFARHGLPLIDNARRILTPDRQLVETAPHGLALCGVGDYWYGKPDYRAALAGLPAAMPRLLLSHNPDVAEHKPLLRSGFRVDLILSGHTHGGQICLPGAGPLIVPSLYGNKYASGMVRGPICPVFVSRGIGESGVPIRFNAMPEVTVFELRAA
jgi:predicted MPP superfamily phosphohydrolase